LQELYLLVNMGGGSHSEPLDKGELCHIAENPESTERHVRVAIGGPN
jgi:hypothetical protein